MSQQALPATPKQLAYLRTLATQTGTTFATPRNRRDASREIDRLRQFKQQHSKYIEAPLQTDRDPTYSPAAHASELTGYGPTARWRTTQRRDPETVSGPATETTRDDDTSPPAAATPTLIGTYRHDQTGTDRELIVISVPHGTLLVDQDADTRTDRRLVGLIDPDEPQENPKILAGLYLEDPSRGRCRAVLPEDLDPPSREPTQDTSGIRWDAPLVAGIGVTFRLQTVPTDAGAALRWTRVPAANDGQETEPVSLRHVVAQLKDYDPATSMTAAAIREHKQQPGSSTHTLAGELNRLQGSAIVLNRRLRERVQLAVDTEGVTMSEIALRCGRIKRDRNGRESGETSWLARRVGLLPEAGKTRPNPWVHSDVLALIARDGLGISPHEVEIPHATD